MTIEQRFTQALQYLKEGKYMECYNLTKSYATSTTNKVPSFGFTFLMAYSSYFLSLVDNQYVEDCYNHFKMIQQLSHERKLKPAEMEMFANATHGLALKIRQKTRKALGLLKDASEYYQICERGNSLNARLCNAAIAICDNQLGYVHAAKQRWNNELQYFTVETPENQHLVAIALSPWLNCDIAEIFSYELNGLKIYELNECFQKISDGFLQLSMLRLFLERRRGSSSEVNENNYNLMNRHP